MITRRTARPLSAFSPQSWICPSCTRTSLRQTLQPKLQRRREHTVPQLDHHKTFSEQGVPGLFSKFGYQIGWTTYQSMIIAKLNKLVGGEPIENMQPKALVTEFARDPMNASLFNHASMAHNNHFFYEALSTSPQRLEDAGRLKASLEQTFGSIETLRITMLDTAAAMFGPGFVWLVWARDLNPTGARKGDWRILSTYLAGTPYPEAGYRQQGLDMNTNNVASYGEYHAGQHVNKVGKFGNLSEVGQKNAQIPPGGTSVLPVLCVNTWEHVYIYDFGLPGKERYLQTWWDTIDWYQVYRRAPDDAKKSSRFD